MNLIGDNGFTAHAERAVQRMEEQEACVHTFAVNIARLRQCGERLHLVVVQHCHRSSTPILLFPLWNGLGFKRIERCFR
jgi:hypothetical protein